MAPAHSRSESNSRLGPFAKHNFGKADQMETIVVGVDVSKGRRHDLWAKVDFRMYLSN